MLDSYPFLLPPPATSKACLKYKRKRIVDIVTFSPVADMKVVQLWSRLGVARSGRESTYFPSESYLGQKEDDDANYDFKTCPPSHGHGHPDPQL